MNFTNVGRGNSPQRQSSLHRQTQQQRQQLSRQLTAQQPAMQQQQQIQQRSGQMSPVPAPVAPRLSMAMEAQPVQASTPLERASIDSAPLMQLNQELIVPPGQECTLLVPQLPLDRGSSEAL